MLLNSYNKKFPQNNIYLISPHDKNDEKAFVPYASKIKQVVIEEGLEIEPDTFSNSLVIMDDIRGMSNPKLNKLVFEMCKNLYYNSRKYNTYLILTNHRLLDGCYNSFFTYEADSFTFFVNSKSVWREIDIYLKKYLGLNAGDLDFVKYSTSRWVTVCNVVPTFILTENIVKLN